jgi:hypothetical protein
MTDAQDNRGVCRLWVCPVAVLVSFPIGGYLADLVVDGVDSVGASLVGGLNRGPNYRSGRMVRPEAMGLVALDRGNEHRNGRGPHHRRSTRRLRDKPRRPRAMGAITGLGVGALQALVLS